MVDYLSDMEGRQVKIYISFDQFYIPYPSFEITFEATSQGMALLYYE